jgi:hypothetical protein
LLGPEVLNQRLLREPDVVGNIVLEGAGDSFCGGFDFSGGPEHYPGTQLTAMKLIVNQAYDNMGLQGTQVLGPILDGAIRNTHEGREFVRVAMEEGEPR